MKWTLCMIKRVWVFVSIMLIDLERKFNFVDEKQLEMERILNLIKPNVMLRLGNEISFCWWEEQLGKERNENFESD